jgi:signal transduction histidine kinase
MAKTRNGNIGVSNTNHQALVRSVERFTEEAIFRGSPGHGISYGNSCLVRMFGYETLQALKAVDEEALYADEEAHLHLIDKMRAERFVVNYRVLYKRKNGSSFWGLFSGKQVLRKGTLAWEGRILNISDLVKIEDQLKDSQVRLEKLTMEFDRFIYSASHDIRSPISTIMGIINLMKVDAVEDLSHKYISMMEKSMTKLDDFVKELTRYGKNSKKTIADQPINFEVMLKGIMEEFKNNHPLFPLITWDLQCSAQKPFYTDRDRLHLILSNIIKNALDYCGQHKSSRIVSISVHTEQGRALIDIFDNGIGIAAIHIDRVFDMFYRATDLSKGAGIGLFMVREAVIKLGGTITLDSSYGVGTSVKINMPNSRKGKLINKKNQLRVSKKILTQ